MSACLLCSKEMKKEIKCSLLAGSVCMSCCFAVSSGGPLINKIRKEKGYLKEDILFKCAACIQEKVTK